ncbi:MAG TPA: hypothetical protein VMB20_01240 [Candidatus Acidoferrum sp.]|nr:hypothetical protein [Candidatus Acidoferrum sp.]
MTFARTFVLGATLTGVLAMSMTSNSTATMGKSLTISMRAQNDSGENGTATLSDTSGGLKVVVVLTGAPKDVPQPTHIHVGTCAHINVAPRYPLSNTVNGQSTSLVKGVRLSALTGATYALNVHKSTNDLGTYVSCGNIK